jgi:hypothetical protein
MELQEMGVNGQGSRETGGSAADRIFFMKYPLPLVHNLSPTTSFLCFQEDCVSPGS